MGSPKPAGGGPQKQFLELLLEGLERCEAAGSARLLVALSGGTDSTSLLLGLHEVFAECVAGPGTGPVPVRAARLEAAHFNHTLRGRESDADERFCSELCKRLSIPLHVGRGDVRAHASQNGISVEAAARDLRYRYVHRTVNSQNLDAVVTAHTMDDQAETVLLAMTRGAGLRGVSGMANVTERADLPAYPGSRPLKVLRPMLLHNRSHTAAYCASKGVAPREDQSNRDVAFARNRIRHNVLPELERINPGVVEALARLASTAGADVELIDALATRALEDATLDEHGALSRETLSALPPALLAHVLREAYGRATGTTVDLDMRSLEAAAGAVLKLPTGGIDLPNGARLVVDHDSVMFVGEEGEHGCPYPESVGESRLASPGSVAFRGGGSLNARRVSPAPDLGSLTRWQAAVDPAAVGETLLVRRRADGDRFQPLGMQTGMKLQDFLVNRHLPARWRDRVPLVVSERGICWVAGERVAEWAKVPDGAKEALLFEYFPPED